MNYIDEICPICRKSFTQDDDIVVCPDCGTPHHRECYKSNNSCANAARHEEGFKWRRRVLRDDPFENEPSGTVVCHVCQTPNSPSEGKCRCCGAELEPVNMRSYQNNNTQRSTSSAPQIQNFNGDIGSVLTYLGYDPNEDIEGSTLNEISSFVGPNILYYVPIFKKMKDLGSKLSFNISCFLFPSLYFANRKMWFWAIIAAVMSVILEMPTFLMAMAESMSGTSGAEPFVDMVKSNEGFINALSAYFKAAEFAMQLVCCLFGNYLYYRYVLRSLKKLRNQGISIKTNPSVVVAAGGVKPSNIIVIALITGVIGLAGLYGIVSCAEIIKTLSLF